MLPKLNRHTAGCQKPGPEKIIQFGGGNFLRGFFGWMVSELCAKELFHGSAIIVKSTRGSNYRHLIGQDCLYHTVLRSSSGLGNKEEVRLICCYSRIIHAHREWPDFLSTATIPTIKFIVSNTTEAGIHYTPGSPLDLASAPESFPAKLCLWLYRRYLHFDGARNMGCRILPCELIPSNGKALKSCVLDYAREWNLGPGFVDWIGDSHAFYDTLPDRIISGYPQDAGKEQKKLGFLDQAIVTGEYYHSWILKGPEELMVDLPFHMAGMNVRLVEDLDLHRMIKVRILNGMHTALVPVGLMSDFSFVSTANQDSTIRSLMELLVFREIIPVIPHSQVELQDYALSVFERFENTFIEHRLLDIALNSMPKFSVRLLPTLVEYFDKFKDLPKVLVFCFSALIKMYGARQESPILRWKDDDDILLFFQKTWTTYTRDKNALIHEILRYEKLWKRDLNTIPGLGKSIVEIWETMERFPLNQCIDQYLEDNGKTDENY